MLIPLATYFLKSNPSLLLTIVESFNDSFYKMDDITIPHGAEFEDTSGAFADPSKTGRNLSVFAFKHANEFGDAGGFQIIEETVKEFSDINLLKGTLKLMFYVR